MTLEGGWIKLLAGKSLGGFDSFYFGDDGGGLNPQVGIKKPEVMIKAFVAKFSCTYQP